MPRRYIIATHLDSFSSSTWSSCAGAAVAEEPAPTLALARAPSRAAMAAAALTLSSRAFEMAAGGPGGGGGTELGGANGLYANGGGDTVLGSLTVCSNWADAGADGTTSAVEGRRTGIPAAALFIVDMARRRR